MSIFKRYKAVICVGFVISISAGITSGILEALVALVITTAVVYVANRIRLEKVSSSK